MKTQFVNPTKLKRAWHVIDAKGKVLGKVASEAAALLRGKYKTNFDPHHDAGDFVIVINSEHVELSGTKWDNKQYYHHTGFVGGIKGENARSLHTKHPTALVETAVQGMLPKGPLGRQMLSKLFVYKAAEHPHAAQKPAARALPN